MKIAFDIQPLLDSEKTGIGWFGYYLVKNFIDDNIMKDHKKHNILLNAFDKYPEKKLKKSGLNIDTDNIQIHKCTFISFKFFKILSLLIHFPYYCCFKENPDITIFFNFYIPPGVKGKKIVMIHDMTYKRFSETQKLKSRTWLNLTLKRTCRRADKILTLSQFSKREIMECLHIPEDKIDVISCGVDKELFYPRTKEEIEKAMNKYKILNEYFLYVGTLEPRKNLKRLIIAYAYANIECRKEKKEFPILVIAGKNGWMYNEIFHIVKRLNLEDKVLFLGYICKKDIPILMSGAKAFVYPSLYEGFGMPPLEAMACNTPVIVTQNASLPEVVGDAGLKVEPENINEIKNALLIMNKNDRLRESMRQKGFNKALTYSWGKVKENLQLSITEILL